jgi:hypothetical protein
MKNASVAAFDGSALEIYPKKDNSQCFAQQKDVLFDEFVHQLQTFSLLRNEFYA